MGLVAEQVAARPALTAPKIVYGRRGKLPADAPQYRCFCGKLVIRCAGDPRVAIEGYCRECRTHVVFDRDIV